MSDVESRAPSARERLLTGLRIAHRELVSAAMREGFRAGVRAGLVAAVGVVALFATWRLLVTMLALEEPMIAPLAVAAMAGTTVVVAAALGAVIGRRRPRSLVETAERLDLAAGTKNRIAAALDLSARPGGGFESLAVLDGVAAFDVAGGTKPQVPPGHPLGRPELVTACLVLSIFFAALAMPLRRHPGRATPGQRDVVAEAPPAETPEARALPGRGVTEARERPPAPPSTRDRPLERNDAAIPAPAPGASESAPSERQTSSGRPAPGKNVPARDARQASLAQGEPTEGTPPAPIPDDRKARSGKPKDVKEATKTIRPPKQKDDQTGATAGQAAAGGGAMSPVKSAWAQKDQSADDPLPENPSEENIEDQAEEEEARGGTQPTLKDRRGATSRDLSISGPGDGGEGRGGPTPQKKARGTASLVLGVPVPDFVRGLLNPGTTKVTHERVEPVPLASEAREPGAFVPRVRPEPRTDRAEIPASLRPALRRFFTVRKTNAPSGAR